MYERYLTILVKSTVSVHSGHQIVSGVGLSCFFLNMHSCSYLIPNFFFHPLRKYLLNIYYMSDIMLEYGDHSDSFTLDMHPSSDKPYLVNCYPTSV